MRPAVVADGSDPATTDGGDGVASGNQVSPDVTAPVLLDGNAISLLGDSSSDGAVTGPSAVTGNDNEGILDFGNDNEGILDFGNGDDGILGFGDDTESSGPIVFVWIGLSVRNGCRR